MTHFYQVDHRSDSRGFRSFAAAERYAHKRVRILDDRGFAESVRIQHWGSGFATVHLDGADRVWTDLTNWEGPLASGSETA